MVRPEQQVHKRCKHTVAESRDTIVIVALRIFEIARGDDQIVSFPYLSCQLGYLFRNGISIGAEYDDDISRRLLHRLSECRSCPFPPLPEYTIAGLIGIFDSAVGRAAIDDDELV